MNYGLIGASGRTGKEIQAVMSEKNYNCVFTFTTNGENFSAVPELLIDFSLPEVFEKTIFYTKKFKVPLIIGTTGLSANQIDELKLLSKEIPVVQSYNFSIGVQLLLKCVDLINSKVDDWDIEISETHHRFKKDKPSGTALMIKNILKKDLNISSQRIGNVPGDHTVQFGNLGEVLTVSHRAISRRAFAEGVLLATEFLKKKKNGFFSFTDVVFEHNNLNER